MSRNLVVIGTRSDDDAGRSSGSAYIFVLPEPASWVLAAIGVAGFFVLVDGRKSLTR
ncbi:MAG: PEP-CTERM sorting domain-containing protein [Pirellulales bacterium]